MIGIRSMVVLSTLGLALAGCSKHETPRSERSSGGDHALKKAGEDIDEAADEAAHEVKHIGNDRDEKVDEAKDAVDKARGAD